MDELFGAPVSIIVLVLGAICAAIAATLILIATRNGILARMAVRNVRRRPARGVLIIIGLMLATAIISSAFTTGDSVAFSIKRTAIDALSSLDLMIRVDEGSDVWNDKAVPEEFPESVFAKVGPLLEADSDIDGVLPALVERVAVMDLRSRQFEVNALFTGLDPARAAGFGSLFDTGGAPVDLGSLGPSEVYIDQDGAEALQARVGDTLGIAVGPGDLSEMTVKGIADGWYFKRSEIEVVVMLPLATAQELLDREGQLSSILISNRGDEFGGEPLTPAIVGRYEALEAVAGAGLEIFEVKTEAIRVANQFGSLFVSFFTTFGLFSIGVGLLLIFLIFSMLAAERKGDLGMSRAVGMQRRHLVRMFMTEGAIYSIGSAAVGAAIGVGIGYLLVVIVSGLFTQDPTIDFALTPHVELRSVLVSFFFGTVVTFATVVFAARRISRLNIVRAIRDIPEPEQARAGRAALVWGIIVTAAGALILVIGFNATQLTAFGLGVSLVPIGMAMILRWRGVSQRWVLTGAGLFLVVYWLLPPSVYNRIREDWNQDFSIFFLTGGMVVTGAVLVTVNNSAVVLMLLSTTIGRIQGLAPIIKSAVSYPLRYKFRTGLSVAMFAVIIFSVTVMSTLIEGFNKLFEDQDRLAGGYEVMAFGLIDTNPITDLRAAVDANPDLAFVQRTNGIPSVGTFRTIRDAEARLAQAAESGLKNSTITGVDDDFLESNRLRIKLATADYATPSGFDSAAVWRALRDNPGLAIANALMVPTRNGFVFDVQEDAFRLDVEGLYLENETLDPIAVTVRDLRSGASFDLTVIGVLDDFASAGPFPGGLYTSTNTLKAALPRDVASTQFFFDTAPGVEDAANKIEAAFFQHGLDTLDVTETLEDLQSANRSFFNLLIGFMALGLVVGTAALGVISARAVVERRHQIGVLRAIGFSRRMVQMSFLAEASFIALLGIGLGLALGLLTAVNVMADIRTDEPQIETLIPWAKVILIGVGAYFFSMLTTLMPSLQASRLAPAEALRYEA